MITTLRSSICRTTADDTEDCPSHRERRKQAGRRWSPVRILYDRTPHDDGGFCPGAEFDRQDFAAMLVNYSLAYGSIVELEGQEYAVLGCEMVEI